MLALLAAYVSMGLLFVLLSLPLLRGRVGPNRWYGFRTPRTLRDPAVWYPANRYMAKYLLGLGIVLIVAAIATFAVPHVTPGQYVIVMTITVLTGTIILCVQAFRYLSKL